MRLEIESKQGSYSKLSWKRIYNDWLHCVIFPDFSYPVICYFFYTGIINPYNTWGGALAVPLEDNYKGNCSGFSLITCSRTYVELGLES